jgi:predicted GH43/DUF377 family glycosyl hydrolase
VAWVKKGLIYRPEGEQPWAQHTVITPTPWQRDEHTIRIFGGFRDSQGVSRIGYIDVAAANPARVLRVSEQPLLDTGRPGTFDDNGVILGDIVERDGRLLMYYVGFQIPSQVKFLAFSGLAISADGGDSFKRYSEAPLLDRTDNALTIRAVHTVLFDEGVWKVWYSVGSGWEIIDGKPFPRYHIRYTESLDGVTFPDAQGVHCLSPGADEYRIGRPRVRRTETGYEMRYTFATLDKRYMTGLAKSPDGTTWTRCDEQTGIAPSAQGWDSEMICYPVELAVRDCRYLFYSGNGMGATGVGYAQWESS